MLAPNPISRNRRLLSTALRDPAAQQLICAAGAWHQDHGPVCFIGMAMRVYRQEMAKEGKHIEYRNLPIGSDNYLWGMHHNDYDEMIDYFGLRCNSILIHLNDQGKSFSYLADKVDDLPLPDDANPPASAPLPKPMVTISVPLHPEPVEMYNLMEEIDQKVKKCLEAAFLG